MQVRTGWLAVLAVVAFSVVTTLHHYMEFTAQVEEENHLCILMSQLGLSIDLMSS